MKKYILHLRINVSYELINSRRHQRDKESECIRIRRTDGKEVEEEVDGRRQREKKGERMREKGSRTF